MSLVDELNKAAIEKPKHGRGSGRQLFVAQKQEITDALDAGYPMTEIWQHLHAAGKMPITYRVFAEYVYRYIKKLKKEDTAKKEKAGGVVQPDLQPKSVTNPPKKFEYSPISDPDILRSRG